MHAQIKRAAMAGLNKKNVVRFSGIHVTEYNDASVETKRSAWKSEESSSQRNLPPRRPSRDLKFLSRIPEDFFSVDSDDSGIDHREPPSQQLVGSTNQLRSILKTKSKYTTPAQASSDFTRTVSLASTDTRWADSNVMSIGNEKTTFSLINHRDSVLDLPQLAQRCKPKFEVQGEIGSIPVPSLVFVGDDDDGALEF